MINIKVFHFHFCKYTGMSIDEILKIAFNKKWQQREFEKYDHLSEIVSWITTESEVFCFSSHTANLGVLNTQKLINKQNQNIELFPIIFIRHPIDRIASVYRYEKNEKTNSWKNNLARTASMRRYIETRLEREFDPQCRNFHCNRLASMLRNIDNDERTDFELACKAFKILPFIGVVERFQNSLDIYSKHLKNFVALVPGFVETRENATSELGMLLDIRLAQVRQEIGVSFFDKLMDINRDDLLLYEMIEKKLNLQYSYFCQSKD
jgi:hypothetical protein